MTRAVRDRILKDANGDIGDHLRNHIHLTNCIHLKNHMHKHSPILRDRTLMKELTALQRSRSLRDPSASPPPWHSALSTDVPFKSGKMASSAGRRRSLGIEPPVDYRSLSGSSPPSEEFIAAIKSKGTEVDGLFHFTGLPSDHSGKSGIRDDTRVKKKESVRVGHSPLHSEKAHHDENGIQLSQGAISRHFERVKKKSHLSEQQMQEAFTKTLSEQLKEFRGESGGDNDAASSNSHPHGRHDHHEMVFDQAEPSFRASCAGLNRVRRRKFRRIKRKQPSGSTGARAQNALSESSNSSVRAVGHQHNQIHDNREFECPQHDVTGAPRKGCGIPWNWSRIHDRGKSFIDMAGRSLSCGLSDPRLKRDGSVSHGRDVTNLPMEFDRSSSGSKPDVPLLVDGFGSHETSENAAWEHDYSGELGIFADSLLKKDIESDFAFEGRSSGLHKQRKDFRGMHQSLTQKYMPKTFRDLVGQNLAVQALSNAVVQRKVGLLYVFYGPHGTGKTSCARILARALNCQSMEHPKPCGLCSSCVAHDLGKSRNIKEVGPVSNFNFQSSMDLLDDITVSQQGSHYRVFIFDDCDNLSLDCWSAISKVIDQAPRRVVFMLVCSSLDVLPHIIISRCQKFFFPKLKDADIIYALQWISTNENLEIDKDAMKLIASRSDGSLRDAEMTLEQLSLIGQKISVTLVQELVGLISDDKLVDLLDLALSADTVNTVKNLREIMESGVDPFALMSQLATVITDILAGSYDFSRDSRRRKFFKHQTLSKEDNEKLRRALKTLSEAEKQLRLSSDKLTWLTAALLQLAPDRQYTLSSSSNETSFNHSPLAMNGNLEMELPRKSNAAHGSTSYNNKGSNNAAIRKTGGNRITSQLAASTVAAAEADGGTGRNSFSRNRTEIEEIWLAVLDKIQIGSVKDFLYQEGKLISLSHGEAPTAQLMFSSSRTKFKADRLRGYILNAFDSALGCPVIVEHRFKSRKDITGISSPLVVPRSGHGGNRMSHSGGSGGRTSSEIIEVTSPPLNNHNHLVVDDKDLSKKRGVEISRVSPSHKRTPTHTGSSQPPRPRELNQCRSLVRGKVSLAHVIQQAEGGANRNAWTRRKAVSIAEKLEQENLRLEPKSRSLLCWKASRDTQRKFSNLKIRSRRSRHTLLNFMSCGRSRRTVLKFMSCGRCLSSRSPR